MLILSVLGLMIWIIGLDKKNKEYQNGGCILTVVGIVLEFIDTILRLI